MLSQDRTGDEPLGQFSVLMEDRHQIGRDLMGAWRRYQISALVIFTAFAAACVDVDDPAGTGGGLGEAELEAYLLANITAGPVIIDAYDRLYKAILGVPQPGVTIVPNASGGTASVGLDFDGDGSMETTASGSVTFLDPQVGFAGGATVAITGITGSSVNGQASAIVVPSGATSVFISAESPVAPSGTFSDGTTTTELHAIGVGMEFGAASSLVGSNSLKLAGYLSGQLHFHVLQGSTKIEADAFFLPDGSGGFSTQIVDEAGGFEFTIP